MGALLRLRLEELKAHTDKFGTPILLTTPEEKT
jgi:hypothetical protein